ncbi:MAG TPA: RagB/SusD family nutrient uptake outer membrane protein [Flavobacterium sp.]
MKSTINYLFAPAAILFFTLSSCEGDFDVQPVNAQSELDFLNDPNNAIKLVNGVYNKQLDYNMYSFSWIGMTSITSDDADKGSSLTDTGSDKHKMDALSFDANDVSFLDVWQGRYQGVGRANTALFYLEQLTIEPTLKSRMIGEVEFLRALFYFDLVRCFGGVPLVTENIDINDTETINAVVYNRKTKEETYAVIEADLLSAIERLPLKSAYSNNDLGRASKGAAQALLAKVYLYQQKWQQAYDMAGDVINSGQYALLDDYAQVWREAGENGSESIYEVQATLTKGLVDYTNVQGPRGTPDLGWGFNTPSISLTNAYEAADQRKAATIMFVPSVLWDGFVAPTTWANPRYNYKAYHSSIAESWDNNRGQTAKNLRILKYSDILLIRAEAGFQIGSSEAVDRINEIRVRAGLAEVNSVTRESILHERRLEMAMEHDRWFDLVRTGQAVSAMAANGKTFLPGIHEVFPIPQQEIVKSSGLLSQNPGY